MVKAKVFVMEKHFDGFPKHDDLKLKEEDLPALKDGEFLAEAVYLSVDPYMRSFGNNVPIGAVFIGYQVAKITESKNPKFAVGTYVVGNFGWRTHTISAGKDVQPVSTLDGLPLSLNLGILGLTGNTAYFGFLEVCKPKPGATVVVSGAAGAVGSTVGQIAKIKGCKVIGIAGNDAKGKWLVDELGFDHFINYKTQNLKQELKKIAPQGIDNYFDNVGGEISSTVLYEMNSFGRVAVCGSVSSYNDNSVKATTVQRALVTHQLTMEGFHVARFASKFGEAVAERLKWIQEGNMKYKETVTEGFENTLSAFIDMLQGGNMGKAIVKV